MERSTVSVLGELLARILNDIPVAEEYEIKKGPLHNLSVSEIHTIEAIGMYSTRTMSEVASVLGITLGALTSAVTNLVNKGYVSRERNDADRRIVNISLTRRGKIAFRLHEKFHLDIIRQITLGLAEKENILLDSLQKLSKLMNSNYLLR